MNLLSLVHNISEGNVTVAGFMNLLTQAIDDDTSVPLIDTWDTKARFVNRSLLGDAEVDDMMRWPVASVTFVVDEWGYRVFLTHDGAVAPCMEIRVHLAFSGFVPSGGAV